MLLFPVFIILFFSTRLYPLPQLLNPFSLPFVVLSSVMKGQGLGSNNIIWDLLFVNKHYSITLIPGFTSKATFGNNDGRYQANSSPQPQVTGGFGYYLHLGKEQSLVSGLNFGTLGRNFEYRIPATEFDPPLRGDIITDGIIAKVYEFAYAAVPVGFENRWLNAKGYINFNVGLSLCFGLQKGREVE